MKTISITAKYVLAANLESMAAPHKEALTHSIDRIEAFTRHYIHANGDTVEVMDFQRNGSGVFIALHVKGEMDTGYLSLHYTSQTVSSYIPEPTQYTPAESRSNRLAKSLLADTAFAALLHELGPILFENWQKGYQYENVIKLIKASIAAEA